MSYQESEFLPPGAAVTLNTCDREPIHRPGAIQPHGVLAVVQEPSLRVLQVSINVELFGGEPPEALLGADVAHLIGHAGRAALVELLGRNSLAPGTTASFPVRLAGQDAPYLALVHRSEGGLIVELEPEDADGAAEWSLPQVLEGALTRLQAAGSVKQLCEIAAEEVRRLIGFDRVMVYRFDEAWNGYVVAEARTAQADSYLGLHFPSTDIPQQARHLYTLNRTRLIADADYVPMPLEPALNPVTGTPTDLTYSTLRSVSPIHLEYLHNMGVQASMSVSIVREDTLWGLIACHHSVPRHVPHATRAACGLLGQVLALLLAGQQETEDRDDIGRLKDVQGRLLEAMIRADDFTDGLLHDERDLLALVEAQGAVLYDDGMILRAGRTPDEAALRALVDWLGPRLEDGPYATRALARDYAPADAFADVGSGLLAVSLSRLQPSYLLWFRPELPETVAWAGEPGKAVRVSRNGTVRLHPRKSFTAWQEVQRGRSAPWRAIHLDAARALRSLIVDVVFSKMEQIRHLNAALRHSNDRLRQRDREMQDFVYIASHDLQEPLRKLRQFASLLTDDFSAQLEGEAAFMLHRMTSAADQMSKLVSDLVDFTRVMTQARPFAPVDLKRAVRQVLRDLKPHLEGIDHQIDVGELPVVEGDAVQLRQLIRLLLDNALTYRSGDRPLRLRIAATEVEVTKEAGSTEQVVLTLEDNGIGFDPKHSERIFVPFQRLHAPDAYSGTGMGLAIGRRIVERHSGTIRAESVPGQGSSFRVVLPLKQPEGAVP